MTHLGRALHVLRAMLGREPNRDETRAVALYLASITGVFESVETLIQARAVAGTDGGLVARAHLAIEAGELVEQRWGAYLARSGGVERRGGS